MIARNAKNCLSINLNGSWPIKLHSDVMYGQYFRHLGMFDMFTLENGWEDSKRLQLAGSKKDKG